MGKSPGLLGLELSPSLTFPSALTSGVWKLAQLNLSHVSRGRLQIARGLANPS